MKVISVTRLISGNNHDNLSATAEVEEGESLVEVGKSLDMVLKATLNDIEEEEQKRARHVWGKNAPEELEDDIPF